jgi:hypothetical protein
MEYQSSLKGFAAQATGRGCKAEKSTSLRLPPKCDLIQDFKLILPIWKVKQPFDLFAVSPRTARGFRPISPLPQSK